MFTNRFLLVISILSLLLVSLAAASPLTNDPVDTSWPPRPVIRPVAAVHNLDVYHRSERTLVDPNAGLVIYQLSERSLMDPQAGLAVYLQSERTSITWRNLNAFNAFQQREWFGK